jgi:hypothetical protein
MSLTIAILSWGAHKTLKNTLNSYREWGLDRLGDERVIFFQEISKYEKLLAATYGYKAIGVPTNVGIAEGYKSLVEYATSDLFLFLENDWRLNGPPDVQIYLGKKMLEERKVDVVRYRDRDEPGNPLWTLQYKGNEYTKPTHLLDAVYYDTDEELARLSELRLNELGFWVTSAHYANWTNNPTMFRTNFLRDNIVDKMGSRDVELDLQTWWEQQSFLVAQGEGLFTHWRIG